MPKKFTIEAELMKKKETKKVVLIDPKGKPWDARMNIDCNGGLTLYGVWHGLRKSNNIREGDVCRFIYIDGKIHVQVLN